jgi:hypothetical protein
MLNVELMGSISSVGSSPYSYPARTPAGPDVTAATLAVSTMKLQGNMVGTLLNTMNANGSALGRLINALA